MKKILITFSIILGIGVVGTILYYVNVGDSVKTSQEIEENREELKKSNPELYEQLLAEEEEYLANNVFSTMEYYMMVLGKTEEEVLELFEEKGMTFEDVSTIAEATEVINQLKTTSTYKVSKELSNVLGEINQDIDEEQDNVLVISLVPDLYTDAEYLEKIEYAKTLGVNNVVAYSDDGISMAKSYYGVGITELDEDSTGGVAYVESFPSIYVLRYGVVDEEVTDKLNSPMIDGLGVVIE